MKKVIIFGDLPIATKVASLIIERKDCVLSAVVIGNHAPKNNDPWDVQLLKDFSKENNVKIITLEDIAVNDVHYDLGISCRFSKIIKKNIIDKFNIGIVNFHGGLLPEFAGLYSVNHTLLSKSLIGGGTLHWIDEGIDTGNIIKRCEIEIENDTALSLFRKTQIALFDGFYEQLEYILSGGKGVEISQYIDQGYSSNYFDKNSLSGKKYIPLENLNDDSLIKISAFYFPPHDPAYTILDGVKINLIPSE